MERVLEDFGVSFIRCAMRADGYRVSCVAHFMGGGVRKACCGSGQAGAPRGPYCRATSVLALIPTDDDALAPGSLSLCIWCTCCMQLCVRDGREGKAGRTPVGSPARSHAFCPTWCWSHRGCVDFCHLLSVILSGALPSHGSWQGYTNLLKTLGSNIIEFLRNLNNLHLHLSNGQPAMEPPAFRVENVGSRGTLPQHRWLRVTATGQAAGVILAACQAVQCRVPPIVRYSPDPVTGCCCLMF